MVTNTVYYIILLALTALFIYIAMKTCLLRDIVVDKDGFHAEANNKKINKPQAPYSLSRTQLAFWTVIIISSFVYTWLHYKGAIPELNTTNLMLLGIAVTTTAGAKVIDDSQKNNVSRSQDSPSEGFFIDLISDKNGVSIHRLQNLLWTLVVGIIYVHFVASQNRLPDETVISDQMLMLMGISTGAYIGLKATENSN
jgi:hypothetical protein